MSKEYAANSFRSYSMRTGPVTENEINEAFPNPNNLKNEAYAKYLKDYFMCTTAYFMQFEDPQSMHRQLQRRDLDTVCAYELYQMKKAFTTTDVLDLGNFV